MSWSGQNDEIAMHVVLFMAEDVCSHVDLSSFTPDTCLHTSILDICWAM